MTDASKSDVPSATVCDRCDGPMHPGAVEDEYGEFVCVNCDQNAAEAAYERLCEDFHDGGSTAWPDAERVRMEAARRLK
jgi:hypothetical protein